MKAAEQILLDMEEAVYQLCNNNRNDGVPVQAFQNTMIPFMDRMDGLRVAANATMQSANLQP